MLAKVGRPVKSEYTPVLATFAKPVKAAPLPVTLPVNVILVAVTLVAVNEAMIAVLAIITLELILLVILLCRLVMNSYLNAVC